ncbi:transposase [Pseudonocardia sp. N23]|uniref:transposase n=1 Tax=Pseudonocardia sp. N23 TaxID=1987376 RepID=UPI000C02F555|nr:transposase [Pseudonocardia sp. N23]GAY08115.1 hypothetical protein TOK_0952 [Pseudonocardia sp. N23]
MPKRYPPEFRRKALDLVAAGRRVAQVASGLDISEHAIYVRRRQDSLGRLTSLEFEILALAAHAA